MAYYFKDGVFVIEDYDKQKPFSSFLPGIAGLKGIPLWSFYANRGQGITSFGIKDKNEPILEFFPANTSYQYVDTYGFRSFVKVDDFVFEPFKTGTEDHVERKMYISMSHFSIVEINHSKKVQYKVTYFGLVNEPIAGLVRTVEVKNLGESRSFEILDGIANILPSGATNDAYKNMSNLMVSWMGVENFENKIPYYKFRASSGDEAEVASHTKGHFYMSFVDDYQLIQPIVDLALIFSHDTSLTRPYGFMGKDIQDICSDHQVLVNKVPCGFTPIKREILSGECLQIKTLIGHVSDASLINEKAASIAYHAYFEAKFSELTHMIENLVGAVNTETNMPLFDAYIKQNFLDNTLRGGYPLVFGEGDDKKIYHVFSRKHGDPERDYNFFSLAPEFYAQGNGNYRDVNQNRRNDVFFIPESGLFNVKMFMNLIQLDGYNPLGVNGTTFKLSQEMANYYAEKYVVDFPDKMAHLLKEKFTPGQISMALLRLKLKLRISEAEFMNLIIGSSEQNIEAHYGEGFWVDHWTYNLDLIENYLSVFPDKLETLLHDDKTYQYYESPAKVLPRNQKYGLDQQGKVRQYGAVEREVYSSRFTQSNWVQNSNGEIYQTNLAQKLMTLVLNKFSSLDSQGLGIEMEADKPGWNDAMNGLPGVFASGMSETVELLRIVRFLLRNLSKDIILLDENYCFLMESKRVLSNDLSHFERWNEMTTVRELFRTRIYNGIGKTEKKMPVLEVKAFLSQVENILAEGIQRAKIGNNGILPTYFTYVPTEYNRLNYLTPYGLEAVEVGQLELLKVPNFLEAPARNLKLDSTCENIKTYQAIKNSDLYDSTFNFYKTSESLEEMSYELGRIRAFTPGWLERESNFLHMTYKYLLGLLKGGLYNAFYEEIKTNLVCFMSPDVYGRSILENSSFIASHVNPNPRIRGQGFVARLSGSTAEMLSIWNMIMYGNALFRFTDQLIFSPKPLIHSDFFKDGLVQTTLFSKTKFIIDNGTGLSTYSDQICLDYFIVDGEIFEEVKGDKAIQIRDGHVTEITMVYKRK